MDLFTLVFIGIFGGTLVVTAIFLIFVYMRHRKELYANTIPVTDDGSDVVIIAHTLRDTVFLSGLVRISWRIGRIARIFVIQLTRFLAHHLMVYVRPLLKKATNQFRPSYRTSAHNGRAASMYLKDISEHKRKISNGVHTSSGQQRHSEDQ